MGMNRLTDRTRSQRGVTLIEMLLVVAIMGIVGAMGTAQMASVRRSMQGDGAMRLVMNQLSLAREMAVTQRRTMEIKFVGGVGGNWIQVLRHEVPGTATTTLSSMAFEGNVTYSSSRASPQIHRIRSVMRARSPSERRRPTRSRPTAR